MRMNNNLKPFSLQAALNGEPVMLRDGSKAYVRHHETEEAVADSWRLWGVITAEAGSASGVTWWTKEGRFTGDVDGSQDIIGMWPKTRIINGFEVPAPETKEPKIGDWLFVSSFFFDELYDEGRWSGDSYDLLILKRGLVFLSKEDAIANAKAMLGINPYEDDEK